MGTRKSLNRNVYSEKLIHRYLIERYYFGERTIIQSLLPDRYKKCTINLIVPEETRVGQGYRADLTIYFKGHKEGVPVEVKWTFFEATKPHQIAYIREHGGFLIAFGGENTTGVEGVVISPDDFARWVSESTSKLTRESIHANTRAKEVGTQTWFVFLRGGAHKNFHNMLREHRNHPFWAYTQNRRSLRHILDVQKGDTCIFVLGSASEGPGVSDKSGLPFEYYAWYRCQITDPYYMVLTGPQSTFFEKGNVGIGERRWPHFTSFTIEESHTSPTKLTIGTRGELSGKIAHSYNYGSGAPVPLSRVEAESLLDRLRAIKYDRV